jgi:hypothetical protein
VPTPEETPEVETFTAAPELIAAQHVDTTDGDVEVRFVFDQAIDSEDVLAENFHLHTMAGENIPGDEAERDEANDNAAIVTFEDAEGDFGTVTVAAVDHEAVVGIDEEDEPTLPNPEGSVRFPEDAGMTEAPVLTQVIISDEDNGEREIVFVFDLVLDDEQEIEPGDFALYVEEGVRTDLTDCDYDEEQTNEVVCVAAQGVLPFPPDPELVAAEDAVLGGVASNTVTADGTDAQNHADSEPVMLDSVDRGFEPLLRLAGIRRRTETTMVIRRPESPDLSR